MGYAMEAQAMVWYDQHRLEVVKSEALRAAQVYEKLGATNKAERSSGIVAAAFVLVNIVTFFNALHALRLLRSRTLFYICYSLVVDYFPLVLCTNLAIGYYRKSTALSGCFRITKSPYPKILFPT
jgi:hypothetical protein